MTTRAKLVYSVMMLALGAGLTYYLVPRRVEIRTQIVEKEVVKTQVVKDVVRTRVRRPDGSLEVRTEVRDRSHSDSTTDTKTDSTKTVEYGSTSYSVTAAYDVLNQDIGLAVSRRLLGPLWTGVSLSQPTSGVGTTTGLRAGVLLGVTLGF